MTIRTISTGTRLATLALAAASAVALAGCEEQAAPSATREATAAPPPADVPLAGAPAGPDGYPPTTRTPEYVPPGPGGSPPYPPPGAYPPPAGPGPYGPPASYPPGYAHANPQGAPPVIVSMAPIPNPPEPAAHGWRRHHHHAWAPGYAPRPRHHWRYAHGAAPYPMPPSHRRPAAHPHAMPAAPQHHAAPAHPRAAAPHPAAPAPGAQLVKPQPLDHRHHHHHAMDAATAAAASGGPTNAMSNETGNETGNVTGSEADRYQALEQSLKAAFDSYAKLATPGHLDSGQTGVVSLTLPPDFAKTVQDDAAKQGLADTVASVNLIGTLTADGYTIVPTEPQTLPLTAGQPTVFQWKVSPTGMDRSAFKVSVRAQSVADGHTMTLGQKTSSSGIGRWLGLGLLVAVALALLGWASRRNRPAPSGSTKPRANHTNGS